MSDTPSVFERAREQLEAGDPAALERDMRALCEREPGNARAHFLRGVALHALARIDEALAAFERSCELAPDDANAHSARAGMLHRAGRPEAAERAYETAMSLAPDDTALAVNLALVREDLGRPEQALAGYDEVLARDPGDLRALQNRAVLLARTGRVDDAVAACRALLALAPDHAAGHANLAHLLLAAGDYAGALAAAEQALRRAPSLARAHADRALALAALGRFDEYVPAARRAHALQPGILRAADGEDGAVDVPDPRIVYLLMAHDRLERADWHDFDRLVRVFEQVAADDRLRATLADRIGLLFRSYVWPVRPERRARLAQRTGELVAARATTRLWLAEPPPRDGRLRLGYLSTDYRRHPGAVALLPVLERHDRRRFHVTAYVLNEDDGSDLRRRLLAAVDSVVDLVGLDDHDAAWRIHASGCDLLVYRDGYTWNTRPGILAEHPAPLQLTWAGYHGTLGGGLAHYHVTEPLSNPAAESTLWSEARLYLPYGPLSFPHGDTPAPGEPPARAGLGLPADGIVLAALHRVEKIDPALFACWMAILRELPGAVLWLLETTPLAGERLRAHAREHGVDDARLRFAPQVGMAAHVRRLAAADLWLDTRWYGSHTTLMDALAMAVPAVSCVGNATQGRIGHAMLAAAGMPELCCERLDEYRRIVVDLARDAPRRQRLAARLRRRDTPLFDVAAFTRSLELGYEMVWRRRLAGLAPCDLSVGVQAYRGAAT